MGQKIIHQLAGKKDIRLIASGRGENRNLKTDGYEYVSVDLTDKTSVKHLFKNFPITHVIHGAAMTHVDQCELDPAECRKNNVDAVRFIVDACKNSSANLIHVSTDFIFDGKSGPYTEEAVANPLSVYGQSKADSETIVIESGLHYAIVRTVLVYGTTDKGDKSNIVLWAKNSLEAGKPIQVVNDKFRTPTLAEDLAQGIIKILMSDKSGIFNISGEEQIGILDLVKRIANFWKLDESLIGETDSVSLGQPAKRPPITGFVITKALKVLGFQPHSIEEGLKMVDAQLKEIAERARI